MIEKVMNKELMSRATFDQNVIGHLAEYQQLALLLKKNKDTLIAYRYASNTAIVIGGENEKDSMILDDDDCYVFFEGNPRNAISNVPDFLKTQVDSMFHALSHPGINAFTICKNGEIRIEFENEEGGSGLYLSHVLLWNKKMKKDYVYISNKDTLLANGCIYRIGMTEYHGH